VLLFTSRIGGVSRGPYAARNLADHVGDDPAAVRQNRAMLAAEVGLPAERLLTMSQVHGTTVAVVDGPVPAPVADALVTRTSDVALAVLVADCVPLLMLDAESGVAAAVHAGRRGLAHGVVPAAVAAMVDLGARPEAIHARLGPSICGRCYEVPADLRDEVAARVPAASARTRHDTPALDIPAGVVDQLRSAGVTDVMTSPICTFEDEEYFSYRRASTTGRAAGVVRLP
jgi:YfiH family protein